MTSVAHEGFYEAALIGPNEDERPGWIPHKNAENTDLRWDMKPEDKSAEDGEWKWTWVYQDEIEKMLPLLSEINQGRLKNTVVEDDMTVIRPDPATPGVIMDYADYHALGLMDHQSPVPKTTPIGVRFYPSSSAASPPGYTKDHPLVLFITSLFNQDEISITWTSGLSPSVIPPLIAVLHQVEGAKSLRAWGLDRDDVLVKEFVKRGGKLEDRTETNFYPIGVAWYGPKGTRARVDGLEIWAFV